MSQFFAYIVLVDDSSWEPGDRVGIKTNFCSPTLDPETGAFWQILEEVPLLVSVL